jgi:hypothetical protein
MDQTVLDRAVEVQDTLVDRDQQRGAKIADLLIAAAAEAAELVVLLCDHDIDLIASVTGQPVEWIFTAGSAPWRAGRIFGVLGDGVAVSTDLGE